MLSSGVTAPNGPAPAAAPRGGFNPPNPHPSPRQRPAALSPRKVITVLTTTAAILPSSLHISTR